VNEATSACVGCGRRPKQARPACCAGPGAGGAQGRLQRGGAAAAAAAGWAGLTTAAAAKITLHVRADSPHRVGEARGARKSILVAAPFLVAPLFWVPVQQERSERTPRVRCRSRAQSRSAWAESGPAVAQPGIAADVQRGDHIRAIGQSRNRPQASHALQLPGLHSCRRPLCAAEPAAGWRCLRVQAL